MTNEVRDLIVNHSFESTTGLRTALLVCFAYPAIKDRLIRRTLESVAKKLCNGSGTWTAPLMELEPRGFRLRVRQTDWPDSLYLAIERAKPDPNTWIGVVRPATCISFEHDLYEALKQAIPSVIPASNHPGYVWGGWLDRRFRDWDSEETILALAEGEEIQTHLSGLLADVNAIVERVLAENHYVAGEDGPVGLTGDQAG